MQYSQDLISTLSNFDTDKEEPFAHDMAHLGADLGNLVRVIFRFKKPVSHNDELTALGWI